ncbi:MAG: hypothetical protein ABMB14_22080, partial [Myxococcota bacterium]
MVQGKSVFAAAVVLGFGLACSGLPVAPSPGFEVDRKLGLAICSGEDVDKTKDVAGPVGAVAMPTLLFTRWDDSALAEPHNGEVQEIGSADPEWQYALKTYCAKESVCQGTSCRFDKPLFAYQIEHRMIDGQPKIVGAFSASMLGGDKAGLDAARKAWLAAVIAKYPFTPGGASGGTPGGTPGGT